VVGVAAPFTAALGGHAVIVAGVAMSLALAVLLAGDPQWRRLTARFMLSAPMAAPLRCMLEAIRRACELVEQIAGARYRAALRGGVVALPVVTLFALFLANADPVLATLRDDLADALFRLEFVPRLLFFLGLLILALGGAGIALQGAGAAAQTAGPARPAGAPGLGDTERLVVLGTVVVLFAAFLLLQASYIFGNVPVTRGSGVTFAEYARHGFAELTTVATLCTLLLVILERQAVRGPRERWARAVAVVVVIEVEVLLLSALRRLWLYESAYGFTIARLYAHTYMIGVALFLALLVWGLWTGLPPEWLARWAAGITAVTIIALLYWNHEAWIVRQNIRQLHPRDCMVRSPS
jgi:Domain of unknown function (DUF4173)